MIIDQYKKMKNLFLRQSYIDAWEDYQRSIRKRSFAQWDYIVLTASNEEQANAFQSQIIYRQNKNVLPCKTKYLVLPDPDGKRVGSGGATLQVLRKLAEQEDIAGDFHNKRILVIHSGGDSKRVPQYSVCGKLFSPVPRELPDGRASTLFDEFLIGMAGVPSRFREGMLVLSGDVLLLFNPLQIDAQFHGAAAISMKSPVDVGKDHGVFLNNGKDYVKKFLHKQSIETLEKLGAVNTHGNVDLDTGAVLFDVNLMNALLSLVQTDGKIDAEKYARFVNEKSRISLYGDFLYPLAEDSTLEQYYKEQPEGTFCEELTECRTRIWEALHSFRMKLICLSPAEFIHFGTTRELLALLTDEIADYEYLDWKPMVFTNYKSKKKVQAAVHNALIEGTVQLADKCYVENSWLRGNTILEKECVISQLELKDVTVPSMVLHGVVLKRDNGEKRYIVRAYGIKDNPKKTLEERGSFLDGDLQSFINLNNLKAEDIWESEDHSLWKAKLYPVTDSQEKAVSWALLLHKMSSEKADEVKVAEWKSLKRYSLEESFQIADASVLVPWEEKLENRILIERFLNRLRAGEHYVDSLKTFGITELDEKQFDMLMEMAEKELPFEEKIRVLYSISRSMKFMKKNFHGTSYDQIEQKCFATIQQEIFKASNVNQVKKYKIAENQVKVSLPVRVNWGGGWTDTPPYCNEKGGVVLNAAILLNGQEPIEVELRKLPEKHIEFASLDLDAHGVVTTAAEIQDCHNPYDSFALHKAALIACGIIPMEGEADLEKILDEMGGGFYMSTCVKGVPKGSGLGTSSILSGACVRALGKFLGTSWSDSDVYELVLNLEQIMSTGGGWQDQVGGLTGGIKYITSRPGMKQKLKVEYLDLDEATKTELQERFALIYTGQRRLARNLLRDVVGNYIGGKKESKEALEEMKHLAVMMRYELEQGDVNAFAKLLNEHWEVSKKLDAGSTNTCIDQIFASCEDLIDGKFISGAGGGGFLQVILKKGVSKEMLRARLLDVYQDSGVDVWNAEFVW
ncbi:MULTISPECIES: L-fucokinase [unclassified Ruminococcus]|uniref:fucose pyrophosphorylase domain-containing protein n=1 Tax=unclassified Ruminococcus TaxID=2608920 RepID=UPI00319E919E